MQSVHGISLREKHAHNISAPALLVCIEVALEARELFIFQKHNVRAHLIDGRGGRRKLNEEGRKN